MIKNGSFNAEKAGYVEGFYGESNCAAVVDNQKEDHAYSIDIYDTGAEDWNIQLMQDGIELEKDKWYKLTLKAKANLKRDILVSLQHIGTADDDWTVYSGGDANRTMKLDGNNEWQDYECVFKMSSNTDKNTRLSITMGAVAGNRITDLHRIFIDDIKLVETEPEDKIFSAKLKLKICELVEKMNEAEPNIVAEGDYCSYPCYEYNRNLINNCPKCGGKVIMDIENPYT